MSNARYAIYSGAPSFPMVACMRAGYRMLENGEAEEVRSIPPSSLQTLPRHGRYLLTKP
jgi:8-amino-7-oxononanoate synthase